jgi:hypothetical protein
VHSDHQSMKCAEQRLVFNQPRIQTSEIIYEEWYASGHSRKNLLTMCGGARNCLRLVVTKDLLWVTSWFPFSLFTPFYDLEHVIPRDQILSVRQSWGLFGRSFLVSLRDDRGNEQSLKLWPWRPTAFRESLRDDTPSHSPDQLS